MEVHGCIYSFSGKMTLPYTAAFSLPNIPTSGSVINQPKVNTNIIERFPIARSLFFEISTRIHNLCVEQLIVRQNEHNGDVQRFLFRCNVNHIDHLGSTYFDIHPFRDAFTRKITLIINGYDDKTISLCAIPHLYDYIFFDNRLQRVVSVTHTEGKTLIKANWGHETIEDFYQEFHVASSYYDTD